MAITAKDKGGGDYDPVEEGTHHAICIGVYDLGTHHDEKWDKSTHEVILMFEFPGLFIELEKDGKKVTMPRGLSRRFTLSLHKKSNLRPFLEGWRGQAFTAEGLAGFDVIKVLGVNCMVQVIHNRPDDKVYANITSAFPLMKNIPIQKPTNPLRSFDFETDTDIKEGTPEWIADYIRSADEWGVGTQPKDDPPPIDDDQIPF